MIFQTGFITIRKASRSIFNRTVMIFLDEIDFKTYLSYLSGYKSKYSFNLYAYALMKNLHLLIAI